MLGKAISIGDLGALDRRSFMRMTGMATATAALSSVGGHQAHAAALSQAQRDKLTPDDVVAMMKAGKERFRLGKESPHDYLAQQKASAKGQYPAAVMLSCIDSRAPAETIMDLGIGDCFNARVAGNIANDDILGSMEFACKLAGAKVVSDGGLACGAIKGAIDNAARHLAGLLAKIAQRCRRRATRRPLTKPSLRRGGAEQRRATIDGGPSRSGSERLGRGVRSPGVLQHRDGGARFLAAAASPSSVRLSRAEWSTASRPRPRRSRCRRGLPVLDERGPGTRTGVPGP
jgi:carbonic anhydrase